VSVAQFHAARSIVEIAAVTARYNMGDRRSAELLLAAEEAGVVFSPWYPTTMVDPSTMASPSGDVAHLDQILRAICERHEATVPQVALAWLLHRSPLMLPIPGTSSRVHFEENLGSAAVALSAEEVKTLTDLVPE